MRRIAALLTLAALLPMTMMLIAPRAYAQVSHSKTPNSRPRARDLGIHPGIYEAGPLNAITDVSGVRVGQVTIMQGDDVRTGVIPRDKAQP